MRAITLLIALAACSPIPAPQTSPAAGSRIEISSFSGLFGGSDWVLLSSDTLIAIARAPDGEISRQTSPRPAGTFEQTRRAALQEIGRGRDGTNRCPDYGTDRIAVISATGETVSYEVFCESAAWSAAQRRLLGIITGQGA